MNRRLLSFLESLLGSSKNTSGTNYAFYSPFVSKRKRKLEIELGSSDGKNPWHCWISKEGGNTIFSLLKRMNAPKEKFSELAEIVGKHTSFIPNLKEEKKKHTPLFLPKEYKPLYGKNNIVDLEMKLAVQYLRNQRGLTNLDIHRYKIGYCSDGKYSGRVIIPSYDSNYNLNYFVARDITDSGIKYLNPPCSRDVVVFEMFINWDEPIILVEGVFDAIRVGNNAIPLMGKSLLGNLKLQLLKHNVSEVFVSLDGDAYNSTVQISEYLFNRGVDVRVVKLEDGDPADIGKEKFKKKMKQSIKVDGEYFIKYKLEGI